jgi:hypothetical protein
VRAVQGRQHGNLQGEKALFRKVKSLILLSLEPCKIFSQMMLTIGKMFGTRRRGERGEENVRARIRARDISSTCRTFA